MEALQPLKVNNQSGVGEGMEADGCGKGGKEEKKNGASETFIVKQPVLGSWLLLGLLQEQTFLGGEGGYRISLPIGSRRIGAWGV